MSYQDWQPKQAPTWFQDDAGVSFFGAMGQAKDDLVDQLRQATMARFPTYAPADALTQIGDERQLDQGPTESNSAYAARLRTAWDAWAFAGSYTGLLNALSIAGYPNVVAVQQNGRYATLMGGGGSLVFGTLGSIATRSHGTGHAGWSFDLRDNFWSEFGLIFLAPFPGQWLCSATAVFDGSALSVPITWPTPFSDTSYKIVKSTTRSSASTIIALDGTTKTQAGITVTAAAPFTGQVDLLAFETGGNPFANPHAGEITYINRLIKQWKPAKATLGFSAALLQGRMWGWPVQTWGAGVNWGPCTVVNFSTVGAN